MMVEDRLWSELCPRCHGLAVEGCEEPGCREGRVLRVTARMGQAAAEAAWQKAAEEGFDLSDEYTRRAVEHVMEAVVQAVRDSAPVRGHYELEM